MEKKLLVIIPVVSFTYYSLLSSKIFTWLFVSGDSGDWLACSKWWMVPQPVGSPLYILLGHFLNIFPGDMVIKMTLFLSCLPSAITVTLIYLTVKYLTGRVGLGLASSLAAMGATVLLTQSTILEEYAVSVMLLTAGIYFSMRERYKLAFTFFGLGMAVHIVIGIISLLILTIRWYQGKKIWREAGILLLVGLAPYSLIILLMVLDTPRLIAGPLDLHHLQGYFLKVGSGIVGTISVFDFPKRLLLFLSIILSSLGLSLIPIIKFKLSANKALLLVPITFSFWYYLTCFDPGTWTFLTFSIPPLCILIGVGLSYMSQLHLKLSIASSITLIILNGAFLNASFLAPREPLASTILEEVESVPDGSAIVTYQGAPGFLVFYSLTRGKDIVPLIWSVVEAEFYGYQEYLDNTWDVQGNNIKELVEDSMEDGREIYIITLREQDWEETKCFISESILGYHYLKRVTGLTDYSPSYFQPPTLPLENSL